MMFRLIAAVMALFLVAGVCLAADKKPLTDDSISDYVRLRLAGDPDVKGGALNAVSKDGVVTLTGIVETQRQKDKASKLAKKVKGVKQVVNNITLKDRNAK
jgi:hyperosmotically inducible periplasmic protein